MSYQTLSDGAAPVPVGVAHVAPAATAAGGAPAVVEQLQMAPSLPNAQHEMTRILASVRRSQSSCIRTSSLIGLFFVAMTVVGWVLYAKGHTGGHWGKDEWGYTAWIDDWDTMRTTGFALGIAGAVCVAILYPSIGCLWCCRRGAMRQLEEDTAQLMEEGSSSGARIMTWKLQGEQWDRWVSENYDNTCARTVCYLCCRGTIAKARSKRNGAVIAICKQGLFIDDVRTVVFQSNMYVTSVRHIQLRTQSGSIEQAIHVDYITESFDKRGRRKIQGRMTLWMPTGALPPAAASSQPGGDVWLQMAQAILLK